MGSFGHTGFTGTSIWMDPTSDTYVVFMSNAVYPNGPTGINAIRGGVATAIARWVKLHPDSGALAATLTGYNESIAGERRWQDRNGKVTTGIDVLEEEHFAPLAALAAKHGGQLRLGLLTNQTGLDAQGRRTIDILVHEAEAAVPGLKLKLLFSPEHGINGALDKEGIQNSKDPSTGLPVVSLYGASASDRRPSLETLRGLDAVLIDLQDAGVRFYTYETVVRYFLEAAGHTGTDIVVLDRPNPIAGAFVQGPLSDAGSESYVNVAPIPVRHGMTLGELARYFNGEYKLGAPLSVVEMKGWQRGDWFDATGLTWTNPSPNLRSLREAILYPAPGLDRDDKCFCRPGNRHSLCLCRGALDRRSAACARAECQVAARSAIPPCGVHAPFSLSLCRSTLSWNRVDRHRPQCCRLTGTWPGDRFRSPQAVRRQIRIE